MYAIIVLHLCVVLIAKVAAVNDGEYAHKLQYIQSICIQMIIATIIGNKIEENFDFEVQLENHGNCV